MSQAWNRKIKGSAYSQQLQSLEEQILYCCFLSPMTVPWNYQERTTHLEREKSSQERLPKEMAPESVFEELAEVNQAKTEGGGKSVC